MNECERMRQITFTILYFVCWQQETQSAAGACSWVHFKRVGLLPVRQNKSLRRRLIFTHAT